MFSDLVSVGQSTLLLLYPANASNICGYLVDTVLKDTLHFRLSHV